MAVLASEEYCDIQEAAQRLGIHPLSLHRLLRRGNGPAPAFKAAGRKYLFRIEEIEKFGQRYNARPGPKSYPLAAAIPR